MKTIAIDILKYILINYPYKSELSTSRLTKMIYLTDWKNALEYGEQITDTVWQFNHYGPYVDDFIELARSDKDIDLKDEITVFGGKKKLFTLKNGFIDEIDIPTREKYIIDFVIEKTKTKNYEEFINLVYSTYPVLVSNKYSSLNLVKLANEYKNTVHNKI